MINKITVSKREYLLAPCLAMITTVFSDPINFSIKNNPALYLTSHHVT